MSLPESIAVALKETYEQGKRTITNLDPRAKPPEPFEHIKKVEEHRWHWRPPCPRLILIAESHVYTATEALIDQDKLGDFFRPEDELPPNEYVALVYCLGYGENQLLTKPQQHRESVGKVTWQFWDIFGRLTHRGKQPRVGHGTPEKRVKWKIDTLSQLKSCGVWLLDASVHAIYLGERKTSSNEYLPETAHAMVAGLW